MFARKLTVCFTFFAWFVKNHGDKVNGIEDSLIAERMRNHPTWKQTF
jgi:hypothetical protein